MSSDSSSDTENSGDTNDSTDSDSVAQKVMGVLDNLPQPLEDNVRATLEKISENGSTTDLLLNFYYTESNFKDKNEEERRQMAIDTATSDDLFISQAKNIMDKVQEIIGTKDTETSNQEYADSLDDFLVNRPGLLEKVNEHQEFKKLLAAEYEKVTKTPESSEETEEPTTQDGDNNEQENPSGPETQSESINRALSGIFLIENEGGTESTEDEAPAPTNTDPSDKTGTQDGAPISVKDAAEVEKMLKELEALFAKAKLEINVRTIWNLSQVKRTEPEDEQEPSMEDESPPDIAEFNENWTEVLMTFFGKNPDKSSFMKRLLLKSQAKMLYDVIDVLEQVTNSSEMSSFTDMNLDDEKEKRADKAQLQEVFPLSSDSTALKLDTSPEGIAKSRGEPADEVEPEQSQPEPEQSQPKPQVQQDKVELPPKTRRIIKQDLQSMVDLLKQLKLAIKDYSLNATRKSADPRFDGSKLKANMDGLLAQVQEDIYDLHSNLKPVDLAPEQEDENLGEALSGIMLEEDDPERQAKIQLVRETYDNAKEEYIYVLMPSMEEGVWNKSQTSAKKILDILKKEEFISLFPTALKTSGGRVMTLGDAYKSMTALIQEFVEPVRDIVLISKKKSISKTSLTQAKNKLEKISLEIAELFRVPSKFSEEEIKQAKEEEAKDPTKQAITDQPENNLEQGQEDHSPGTTTDEDSGTEDPSSGEQPTEPEPPMTQQESDQKIKKYILDNGTIQKIESTKVRAHFFSFVKILLGSLLDTNIKESIVGNVKGRLRTFYSDMDKIVDNIVKKTELPKDILKDPIKNALESKQNYELLLREMSTKDLTNLIVDYIKNENLFKLLLLEDKLATSFTSLVTVLGMDNEGTLERNTDGKDPLPEEYVEKIIKKQYPEAMSNDGLASLLHDSLAGDLGQDIANHFNKKIKSLFTLKQKDPTSDYTKEDTDDLDSYLFDSISQINMLSGTRNTYGKYVSLYLANVYEQFANKSLFNNQEKFKISDSYENVYAKRPKEELDSFIEKYESAYKSFKKHFKEIDGRGKELNDFIIDVLDANFATQQKLGAMSDDNEAQAFIEDLQNPNRDPILKLSNAQVFELAKTIKISYPDKNKQETSSQLPFGSKTTFRENDDFDNLEEALKPIIATMLKEHYNK